MTFIDWAIVIGINGAIVVYGLLRSRDTKTSADWFLAGRTLPWWIVGLSLYATAIDSSDVVADAGLTHQVGFSYFLCNWVGVIAGWLVGAHFIVLPMYRAGMYTNAEYLEARFGPAARIVSALVQVQYRTLILGIIVNTLFLVLAVGCGWDSTTAWTAVCLTALLATIYTALGGLKSVAVTDALQTIVMVAASVTFFFVVWGHIDGWDGLESRLTAIDPDLKTELLNIGHPTTNEIDVSGKRPEEIASLQRLHDGQYDESQRTILTLTPAWLVSLAWIFVGFAYSIVNHTQSMRLFGSRSEWDLKMSVTIASAILIVTSFTNLTIGIMGRALYPDLSAMPLEAELQNADSIYPLVLRELGTIGLKGLIVAGVVAAALSTFDSIGSTLSSLLVRDVYARLLVKNRDDRHYLRVGQWLTPFIVFGSFAYVPFFDGGMVFFYLELVSAWVIPLLTAYVLGVFTRVHRSSGIIGLFVGVAYGVLRLFAPTIATHFDIVVLPSVMVDGYAAYTISFSLTALTMVAVSLVLGWESPGQLLHKEKEGWLRSSQEQASQLTAVDSRPRRDLWPLLIAVVLLASGVFLSFVIFW